MTDVIDPVEALRKLTNEAFAVLSAGNALRDAIGNTNYAVLKFHAENARAALTAAEAAGLVWVKRDVLDAFDANVERLKACEHIAEGEEGWETLRNLCPSTAAVATLRDALAARPSLTGPEQATREGDETP